jgi:hypothetical protein
LGSLSYLVFMQQGCQSDRLALIRARSFVTSSPMRRDHWRSLPARAVRCTPSEGGFVGALPGALAVGGAGGTLSERGAAGTSPAARTGRAGSGSARPDRNRQRGLGASIATTVFVEALGRYARVRTILEAGHPPEAASVCVASKRRSATRRCNTSFRCEIRYSVRFQRPSAAVQARASASASPRSDFRTGN